MTRIEIYNRMKELGVKHYINSATMHSNYSSKKFTIFDGFHKCHRTDESFEKEISNLTKRGYDYFDVIHLHE